MGKQTLRNVYVAVNGTAVSDHASSVSIDTAAEEIDFTSFSANGYREFGQGLKDATVTVTFFNDYASGSIDSILRPLFETGGTCTLSLRPDAASAVSATNPGGTMVARLLTWPTLGGAVGEANVADAVFRNAGTAGLTWGTL